MILERQLLLNIRLNRLRWFGHVQRMEENKIPERVSYINLRTTGLRGRQRNRSQYGMREDGRVAGWGRVAGKST